MSGCCDILFFEDPTTHTQTVMNVERIVVGKGADFIDLASTTCP